MTGNLRTFLLMAAMTALLMGMGWLIGGQGGAILALLVAGAGNLWAWWNTGNERALSRRLRRCMVVGRRQCARCTQSFHCVTGSARC